MRQRGSEREREESERDKSQRKGTETQRKMKLGEGKREREREVGRGRETRPKESGQRPRDRQREGALESRGQRFWSPCHEGWKAPPPATASRPQHLPLLFPGPSPQSLTHKAGVAASQGLGPQPPQEPAVHLNLLSVPSLGHAVAPTFPGRGSPTSSYSQQWPTPLESSKAADWEPRSAQPPGP